MASRTPFCRSSLERFKKKLTVIGIIGHMQGMTRASNPPTIPIRNIYNKEWLAILLLPSNCCNCFTTGSHRAWASVPESCAVALALGSANESAWSEAVESIFAAVALTCVLAVASFLFSSLMPLADFASVFALATAGLLPDFLTKGLDAYKRH